MKLDTRARVEIMETNKRRIPNYSMSIKHVKLAPTLSVPRVAKQAVILVTSRPGKLIPNPLSQDLVT